MAMEASIMAGTNNMHSVRLTTELREDHEKLTPVGARGVIKVCKVRVARRKW